MMENNKRGGVADLTVNYFVTIFVIVILVIFVLGSSAIKEFSNVKNGVKVYDETSIGIGEVIDYVGDGFKEHVKKRLGIEEKEFGGLEG